MGLRHKIKRQHADKIGKKFWRDIIITVPAVFIFNELGYTAAAALAPAFLLMVYREIRAK